MKGNVAHLPAKDFAFGQVQDWIRIVLLWEIIIIFNHS